MKIKNLILFLSIIFYNFITSQIIVIDPGHGYCSDCTQDCVSPNSRRTVTEIETNMAVGSKLKVLLDNNCSSVTAHLTRTTNGCGDFPSLNQREIMSNNWGADRFLSIHCNGGGGTGSEAFWCNSGPSSNSACQSFATVIQGKITAAGSFNDRRIVEDNSYLGFHLGVLNNVNAINCLSEIGFVDNASDNAKLISNTYRNAFAQAYVEAFEISLGFSCSSTPPVLDCQNAVALTCGTTYSGSASSAPSAIYTYGCNSWTETGPERVHTIVSTGNGTLTATISNFTGDLDVYILGSCDPTDCLGTVAGAASTITNAVAGTTYYIVVDADDGSGSAYDLIVTCPPSAPEVLDCSSSIALTCEVSYSGVTSTATSNVSTYGCATNINSSGPERVHTIVPSANGLITATISNYNGNLDVYILGSCDASDCLGSITYNSATYNNAIAGQIYYVVVDAADGSGSSYDVVVTCPTPPPVLDCSNAIPLSCGVTYSGTSSANSSNTSTYGCNSWNEIGPERVHTITTQSNGSINAVLSNFSGNLDVFILGSCDPSDCIGVSFDDSAIFANTIANQTYYIVVDSRDGTGGSYDLTVSCLGNPTGNEDITVSNTSVSPFNVTAGSVVLVSANQNYSGGLYTSSLSDVNLDYILSSDCNLSNDDIYLGGSISNLGVDNPASYESANLSIPISTPVGNYYIIFAGDNSNVVNENDETNNLNCFQITVTAVGVTDDISLSNTAISEDTVTAGDVIVASSSQNYSGTQSSNNLPIIELNYYLSTDCILSNDDVLLGDDISSLGANNTSSNEIENLTIPTNIIAGTYYILFVADDNNALNELNENNNIECKTIVIRSDYVSINQLSFSDNVYIYPNPTSGIINFSTDITSFELYNNLGLRLLSAKIKDNSYNIESLPKGIYYIKAKSNSRDNIVLTIIKN